jgi:hypothetical protein
VLHWSAVASNGLRPLRPGFPDIFTSSPAPVRPRLACARENNIAAAAGLGSVQTLAPRGLSSRSFPNLCLMDSRIFKFSVNSVLLRSPLRSLEFIALNWGTVMTRLVIRSDRATPAESGVVEV